MKRKHNKHRHHSRLHQAAPKRSLHVLTVPQAANQYRPHIVRRYGLLAVIALVIGLQFIQHTTPYQAVLGDTTAVTPDNVLAYSNNARRDDNETRLRANRQLTQAATLKAKDMLAKQYWSHTSPKGVQPWHWMDEAGYQYTIAGENLAKNFATSDGVVKAWMASPTHRENLLSHRFTDVGIAVANGKFQGKDASIVVALYAAPATAVAAGAVNDDSSGEGAIFHTSPTTAGQIGVLERAVITLETLTPIAVISVVILLSIALVALMAQVMRHKLPQSHRERWYRRHHGLLKSIGLSALAVAIVMVYAGGQL